MVQGASPSQGWKTFFRNHAHAIAAIDLFVVPTPRFERLFAFLVAGHGRRQLLWFEVTRHPTAEWLARLQREGVPVAPINSVDQVVNDPQVLLREMVVDLEHPTLGTLRTLGTPVKEAGAPPFRPVPPRALGEDTDVVLRQLLGYSAERIAELRDRRVVA